eukprot:scaffold2754_cov388-Prasinococcus_capsulatus_cf.AAC.6
MILYKQKLVYTLSVGTHGYSGLQLRQGQRRPWRMSLWIDRTSSGPCNNLAIRKSNWLPRGSIIQTMKYALASATS